MKVGKITTASMRNGKQDKDVPADESAPNTRTASDIQAVYRGASRRRAERYRVIDFREEGGTHGAS